MVVISPYAYNVMLTELEEFADAETGGLLLGFRADEKIYVIEATESGVNAIHEPTKTIADVEYLNYRSKNISRLYDPPLEIIGVWHKHNHCLEPPFSDEDINTHENILNEDRKSIVSILFQKCQEDTLMKVYICSKFKKYEQHDFIIKSINEHSLRYEQ